MKKNEKLITPTTVTTDTADFARDTALDMRALDENVNTGAERDLSKFFAGELPSKLDGIPVQFHQELLTRLVLLEAEARAHIEPHAERKSRLLKAMEPKD